MAVFVLFMQQSTNNFISLHFVDLHIMLSVKVSQGRNLHHTAVSSTMSMNNYVLMKSLSVKLVLNSFCNTVNTTERTIYGNEIRES